VDAAWSDVSPRVYQRGKFALNVPVISYNYDSHFDHTIMTMRE
jgi:hypothetical protein